MDTSTAKTEEIKSRKRPQLAAYSELLSTLEALNLRSQQTQDKAELAKLSLTKLLITKRFANIDEEILEISKQRMSANAGEFFSDILVFEAKRLAFKEAANQCQKQANQTQV